MYRDIAYTVYLFVVLVESHTAQLLCEAEKKMLDYYCTRIEVSVLRGGGGGGSLHKVVLNLFSKNIPGVLKRKFGVGGGVRRAGSENDTLLPLTIKMATISERYVLALKSYRLETMTAETKI